MIASVSSITPSYGKPVAFKGRLPGKLSDATVFEALELIKSMDSRDMEALYRVASQISRFEIPTMRAKLIELTVKHCVEYLREVHRASSRDFSAMNDPIYRERENAVLPVLRELGTQLDRLHKLDPKAASDIYQSMKTNAYLKHFYREAVQPEPPKNKLALSDWRTKWQARFSAWLAAARRWCGLD